MNGLTTIHSMVLEYWMTFFKRLIYDFVDISFSHTYREYDLEADHLSKKCIDELNGILNFEVLRDGD